MYREVYNKGLAPPTKKKIVSYCSLVFAATPTTWHAPNRRSKMILIYQKEPAVHMRSALSNHKCTRRMP